MSTPDKTHITLADYAADCARLDLDGFRRTHAEAFLVTPRHCVLITPPPRPSGTLLMPAVVAPVPQSARPPDHDAASLVFPLRRRQQAIFSFTSVGRASNADVTIPDTTLSKLHAVFVKQGDGFVVEDTRSANGTFLNGVRIQGRGQGQPSSVRPGDRLRFGNVELVFFTTEAFIKLVQAVVRLRP